MFKAIFQNIKKLLGAKVDANGFNKVTRNKLKAAMSSLKSGKGKSFPNVQSVIDYIRNRSK